MTIIKLKEAIDIDDLLCVQYFEFDGVSTRGGKMHTDTFACKIRGLRQKQTTQSHFEDVEHDDGTRKIQIPNESKVSKPKPVFGPKEEKR